MNAILRVAMNFGRRWRDDRCRRPDWNGNECELRIQRSPRLVKVVEYEEPYQVMNQTWYQKVRTTILRGIVIFVVLNALTLDLGWGGRRDHQPGREIERRFG